jgi:hypothetical protein
MASLDIIAKTGSGLRAKSRDGAPHLIRRPNYDFLCALPFAVLIVEATFASSGRRLLTNKITVFAIAASLFCAPVGDRMRGSTANGVFL